jgi:hypothetical protein
MNPQIEEGERRNRAKKKGREGGLNRKRTDGDE